MNKKILRSVFACALLAVVLFLPIVILAQAPPAGGAAGAGKVKTPTEIADAVATMAQTIGAAIVVIGWVITGILYLTAGGAPEKLGTAKKALIAVVIGTILIVIAKLGYDGVKTFITPIIGG